MSAESSRTWVKARKKWTVEDNAALAKKDILHSIRDLLLGTTPLRVAPAAVTVTVAKVVVTMLTVVVKLDEGAELAETGTITHFDAANELAMEMRQETSTEWEYYKRKYQPIYNKARTRTRHNHCSCGVCGVTNTTHDTHTTYGGLGPVRRARGSSWQRPRERAWSRDERSSSTPPRQNSCKPCATSSLSTLMWKMKVGHS